MKPCPLTVQFESECLRRYLVDNPDDAQDQAIAYFEQFTTLAHRYRELSDQNRMLKSILMKVHRDSSNALPEFVERILSEPEEDTQTNKFSSN